MIVHSHLEAAQAHNTLVLVALLNSKIQDQILVLVLVLVLVQNKRFSNLMEYNYEYGKK